MKACPRCLKKYDDSWAVCAVCKIALETSDDKNIAELRESLMSLRKDMKVLSNRVSALEMGIAHGSDRAPSIGSAEIAKRSEEEVPSPENPPNNPGTGEYAKDAGQEPEPAPKITAENELVSPQPRAEESYEKNWAAIHSGEDKKSDLPGVQKKWAENFEQLLGGKWFNKLGTIAVVVGMALLLGYSFKYMGPVIKLGLGYICGMALLFAGIKLEKKEGFSVYGRTLISGGWAVNYFTTFAMHHIKDVQLVANPVLGLFMLLGMSCLSVAHIYRYRSETATAFSYLLIFITLMVTPMSPYSVAAALLAACSLVYFMFRFGWNEFALYGIIMSYVTFMVWGKKPRTDIEFYTGLSFMLIFWAVFVFAAFLMSNEKKNRAQGRISLLGGNIKEKTHIVNTLFLSFVSYNLVVPGFTHTLPVVLGLYAGLYLGITILAEVFRQRPLSRISLVFYTVFQSLWLVRMVDGYELTIFYLLLMDLILMAGIFIKDRFWENVAFTGSALAFGKLALYGPVAALFYPGWLATGGAPSTGYFFICLAYLLIYWGISMRASFLIEDRGQIDRSGYKISMGTKEYVFIGTSSMSVLSGLQLVASGFGKYAMPMLLLGIACYAAISAVSFILRNRAICLMSSGIAAMFAIVWSTSRFSGYSLTVAYIIIAQALLFCGVFFREKWWRVASSVFMAAILSKLVLLDSFLYGQGAGAGLGMRTLLFGFAFCVYLVNYAVYYDLKKKGLTDDEEKYIPALMSYSYPLVFMMGTWLDLPMILTAPSWVIMGVVLLQFGVSKDNYHQRIQGYGIMMMSFVRLIMSNITVPGGVSLISYRLMTAAPVLLCMHYGALLIQDSAYDIIIKPAENRMRYVLPYMVFAGLMMLLMYELPIGTVCLAWSIVALTYLFGSAYSGKGCYLSIASIAAVCAAARIVFINLLGQAYGSSIGTGIVFPVMAIGILYAGNVFYLYSKDTIEKKDTGEAGILRMLTRSPRLIMGLMATLALTSIVIFKVDRSLITVGLGLEGVGLFLAGLGVREKNWRLYGLVVLLAAVVKTFLVDLRNVGTLYYILSLIVLGILLLFVSFMYTKYKDKLKRLL